MKGSSVPTAARLATAKTARGPLGAAGMPSVMTAIGSTARAAPRNCTAVTATGSRPGRIRLWATVKVADSSSDARTRASPTPVAPPPRPPATRPTPARDTANPAQATGRATVWCHNAAMTATSTGAAPISSAACVTLVWITALQADADRTNVELARLTGLSPAATLQRVRWLKETGVIRIISAQLDPAAVGLPLQLYVTATLSRHDPRSSRIFEDQIRALPQIITADNVAGETDYLLTVVARDVTDLQEVLASLSTRGGHRLVTYLRLAEVKPPSRLPLVPTTPATAGTPRRRRRAATAPGRGR